MEREIYTTDGEYAICPIIEQDHNKYVELCRQINGDGTFYINSYYQDIMWEQTLKGETKIFSIFDGNKQYCGSIELKKPTSKTPEIGIDLMKNMRNQGIASRIVKMFAKRTYEKQEVEYFLIRISSRNSHSKHVFEKLGAILIGEEDSLFMSIIKDFKKVVGEKEFSAIQERLGETKDTEEEIIYRYKFPPDLFLDN